MAIQDVEKACDERVLFNSTVDERRAYARVLLELFKDTSAKSVVVGFGTLNIMKHIKNIGKNKQKKRIYTVLIVFVFCSFLGVCALLHLKTDYQKIASTIGKLSDFIAFAEIGFSSNIQGDNPTFAFSGDSGNIVYISKYTKLYWKYEGNEGIYSDLRLTLDKNGDMEEYTIFK